MGDAVMKNLLAIAALAAVACLAATTNARAQISCAPPPKAQPQRIKGGEGFPPLPLPVTPLRRTERKKPPAPPTLMAKINYGALAMVEQDGRKARRYQWTMALGDTQSLFDYARRELGEVANYKADVMRFNEFGYSPDKTPVIYFTGQEGFELTPLERNLIRNYVLQGGYVFANSSSGKDSFTASFKKEFQTIFPDRPWFTLPPEHPLFHNHFQLASLRHKEGASKFENRFPTIYGINVGCRTAILFTPYDVACGWDGHTHDFGKRIDIEDARRFGVNLLAYCLAYYRLGRTQSIVKVFAPDSATPGDVEIAQIRHQGDWDPHATGISNLMKAFALSTSGQPTYKRVGVEADAPEIFNYPFLYLTGHLNFTLTDKGRENLKRYLDGGGFLFIHNCCDRRDFDQAVRRELKAIFPDDALAELPADHPIFSSNAPINPTQLPAGGVSGFNLAKPSLLGLTRQGYTCVVYSPVSLSGGWENEPRPLIAAVDPDTSLKLGVNVLVYAMTH
jgi:hypothetical protein